ncbi:exodeoxyribonuclease V subunit alpha [Amphritea sp. HPY]|uniref:exodeoxyribonuclease V subunit alpha n=1 Tax=Amphritea sp. HPY TaxID=3421652 RepID=UPI003D7DCB3C
MDTGQQLQQRSQFLSQLKAMKLIRPLDYQFARFIAGQEASDEIDSTDNSVVPLLAALTSYQLSRGEVCLPLNQLTQVVADWPQRLRDHLLQLLPEQLLDEQRLVNSRTISSGSEEAPLVMSSGRLYLYRYWRYEHFVADTIKHLAKPRQLNIDSVRQQLGQLFPEADKAENQETDWQKVAVAVALSRRFSVISGGPGTGKTTTVTRLLGLYVQQAMASGKVPLICLAAPTGKAAARLSESIGSAKARLPLTTDIIEQIPDHATTLHRLLGPVPNSRQFKHQRDNPLHLDLLVVDEASMIDLPMMARLLDALPEHASVIFIGDKDQLASVEAGSVLGDICAWDFVAGDGELRYQQQQADYLAAVCQIKPGEVAGGCSAMADSLALLRKSYRFRADSGIGRLAGLINSGQAKAVPDLFRQSFDDIRLEPLTADSYGQLIRDTAVGYRDYLSLVNSTAEPEQVLQAFNRSQLLAMVRQGPYGVEGLNQAVEQRLSGEGLILKQGGWYSGRPIMISRNDYQLGLYNGDIGIAIADQSGELRVWFEQPDGSARGILPSRLPEHETVYAMTVHKSQGSEFEQVIMLLPPEHNPLLTRELIYTGVTRAKQNFILYTTTSALQQAVAKRTERASGLAQWLW